MHIPKHREQLVSDYESGRREFSRIELSNVDLSEVNFSEADFSGSDLTDVNFATANLERANFSGAYLDRAILTSSSLSGANFQGAELGEANMEGSNLTGSNLSRSNLASAKLMASNLSGVDLGQASLEGVNLEQADLSNANVEQTNLKNANLKHANLTGVNLEHALLEEAIYNEETQFPDGFNPDDAGMQPANAMSEMAEATIAQYNNGQRDFSRINLSKNRMHQADFSEANLTAADLSEADLSKTNFSKAIMRGAILSDSNLKQANLTQADLRGAYLDRCQLIEAIFLKVNMGRADLSSANLSGAQLERANLEQASLSGATLTGADFAKANLVQANLNQANLEKANLSGTNLSGASLAQSNLQGALYTKDTQFPKDFDPTANGMIAYDRGQPMPAETSASKAVNSVNAKANSTRANVTQVNGSKADVAETTVLEGKQTESRGETSPSNSLAEGLNGSNFNVLTQLQPAQPPEPLTPPASSDNIRQDSSILNLAIRLDVSKLSRLLAEELWEDASVETMKLLLLSCRQQNSQLDAETIAMIPAEVIRAIDILWSESSNGKYGFKAQMSLLEELRNRNPFDGFEEIYKLFLERVRWKVIHYRSSYAIKAERSDHQITGQFPVYLKYFLIKKILGLSYATNLDGLNYFWTHLRDATATAIVSQDPLATSKLARFADRERTASNNRNKGKDRQPIRSESPRDRNVSANSKQGVFTVSKFQREELQRTLAEYLGPMARLTLKNAIESASSPQSLVNSLLAWLPGDCRKTFRESALHLLCHRTNNVSPPDGIAASTSTLKSEDLPREIPAPTESETTSLARPFVEFCQAELAKQIGPIAAIAIQKSLNGRYTLETRQSFVDRLSTYIAEPEAVAAFQQAVEDWEPS